MKPEPKLCQDIRPIKKWMNRPISPTCEKLQGAAYHSCGKPTAYVYPAAGAGWMALCAEHGESFLPHVCTIADAIASGETFAEPAPRPA